MSNARVVNGPMQVLPVSNVSARTVSVSGTAVSLIVAALNTNTNAIYFTLEGADVRLMIDGSNPTVSVGHLFTNGTTGIWSRRWAETVKVIAVSGTAVFTITELNHL